MEFLFGLFAGLIGVGICEYIAYKIKKPSGTFIIDFRDPEKDVCRLELDESIDDIYVKKEITLRVKTFDFSQQ